MLKPRKKGFPWLWVIVSLFIVGFAIVFWQVSFSSKPPNSPNLKAAIIDQLSSTYPNENFTIEVKGSLEAYGFQVDVYQGDEVTVGLYQNLTSDDYKLIILRSHSGLIQHNSQEVLPVTLFTNEPYNTMKYPFEQLNDRLIVVQATKDSPRLFGIQPNFIIKSMKGNFHNTVVIVAGCSGFYNNILALTFTLKGASTFLGWDGSVSGDYLDKATITLMKNLLSDKNTVEKAVEIVTAEDGRDLQSQASLKYYPPQNGDKTLRQLIQ